MADYDPSSANIYLFSSFTLNIYRLTPMPPARLQRISPERVRCVAGEGVVLEARLSHVDGTPIPWQSVRFSASDKLISRPYLELTSAEGIARLSGQFYAPCRSAVVTARSQGLPSVSFTLEPVPPPAPPPLPGSSGVAARTPSGSSAPAQDVLSYSIGTVAEASIGDGGPARQATLGEPRGLALDKQGNLYFADTLHHRIRRVDTKGTITTVAGTGFGGFNGDGIPATEAHLNAPTSVAVDDGGSLFIADSRNYRFRKVSVDGVISTIAGTGWAGPDEPGKAPIETNLDLPYRIYPRPDGKIYLVTLGYFKTVWTLEGTNPLVRTQNLWGQADTLAFGRDGTLYFSGQSRVVKLSNAIGGREDVFIFDGEQPGPYGRFEDSNIKDFVIDDRGRAYVCIGHRVRMGLSPLAVRTLSGQYATRGFRGDGGPAEAALFHYPESLLLAPDGRLLIADTGNHRIRAILTDGTIETIVGGGHSSEGATALLAPSGVDLTDDGALWVADTGRSALRKIPLGDGRAEALSNPLLEAPRGIRVARDGVIATMPLLHSVGRIGFDGSFARIAGDPNNHTGSITYERIFEGGTALWALHLDPLDVAIDRDSSLFVADGFHKTIRKVTPDGSIYTVAPGLRLGEPSALALDQDGRLFIADRLSNQVFRIDVNGDLAVVLGTGVAGYGEDGRAGWESETVAPEAVATDWAGNVYVAGGGRVWKVLADGRSYLIAGGGSVWQTGESEGKPALESSLAQVSGITVDGDGIVYLSEKGANRIRKLIPAVSGDELPRSISWDFTASAQGWIPSNATTRVENGFLIMDPTGPDPYLSGPRISLKAEDFPYLQIRKSAACQGRGQIYFRTAEGNGYSEQRKVEFDPQACPSCEDAPMRIHTIRMSSHPQWARGAVITSVRLDPCGAGWADRKDDQVRIDYVRLSPVP